MADALCGPSNPLQQFKHQTALDRTLQQDRQRSHLPSPHSQQGFRSHDPNAGRLDPEFDAFQAGRPAPHEVFPQQPHGFGPSPYGGQMGGGNGMATGAPDWAADFQRMNLASPPRTQQHHFQPQSQANWAQDFPTHHLAQQAPRAPSSSSPSPLAFQQRARFGPGYNGGTGMGMGFQSQFAQHQSPSFAPASLQHDQGKGKEPVMDNFDSAAFDRAFDQAWGDMLEGEGEVDFDGLQHSKEYAQDTSGELVDAARAEGLVGEQERYNTSLPLQEQKQQQNVHWNTANIPSPELSRGMEDADMMEYQEMERLGQQVDEEQAQKPGEDDDALAATAQELLEKVEHNKTDKFQNSRFLGLMRQLRDREVKVQGDQMVSQSEQTVSSSSTSASQPLATAGIPRHVSQPPKSDLRPPPSPHDSGFASGASTPGVRQTTLQVDGYHFDTHSCNHPGCKIDHSFDHWESPWVH